MNAIREDLVIIFTYHSEETNSGDSKIKTAGKLVDAYLTIEGLFSTVLYTQSIMNHVDKKLEFSFLTQNNGSNTAKSPAGMFDELVIPNDMGYVIKKMKEYYE